MSAQKRTYSTRWTTEMVDAFIKARIELDSAFTKKTMRLQDSWELVGQRCDTEEHWTQLRKRWNNLIDKYKRIREPPTGSGAEGADTATTWPHYAVLHAYCSQRHTFKPVLLINSEQPPAELDLGPSTSSGAVSTANAFAPVSAIDDVPRVSGPRCSSSRSHTSTSPLSETEQSLLRTDRELRKAAKCFRKYMEQKHGIYASSDSD